MNDFILQQVQPFVNTHQFGNIRGLEEKIKRNRQKTKGLFKPVLINNKVINIAILLVKETLHVFMPDGK